MEFVTTSVVAVRFWMVELVTVSLVVVTDSKVPL